MQIGIQLKVFQSIFLQFFYFSLGLYMLKFQKKKEDKKKHIYIVEALKQEYETYIIKLKLLE